MANWSKVEDELIIEDYFKMLNAELRGLPYSKTEHRNGLLKKLIGRNEGAIEFKHQNISAVLIKYGMPYINGYKPLGRYQHLLEDEVLLVLDKQKGIEKVFNDFANSPKIEVPQNVDFANWQVKPPKSLFKKKESYRTFTPAKRNYLEIEQNNRAIGSAGEQFVFDYEKWRLKTAKLPHLADQVSWVAKEHGDGTGYDILSKTKTGKDMYIEVKSTKLGMQSPIFFSDTEYDFSKINSASFFLYRVFNLKEKPQIFIKPGGFNDICSYIQATKYQGYF